MPALDPATMMNTSAFAYSQSPSTLQQHAPQAQLAAQQYRQQQQQQQQQQQHALLSNALVDMAQTPEQLQHMMALAAGMAPQASGPTAGMPDDDTPKKRMGATSQAQMTAALSQASSLSPGATTPSGRDTHARVPQPSTASKAAATSFALPQQPLQQPAASPLQLWLSQQQLLQHIASVQQSNSGAVKGPLPQQQLPTTLPASNARPLAPTQAFTTGWPIPHPHPAFGMAVQPSPQAPHTAAPQYGAAPHLMHSPMSSIPWHAMGQQQPSGVQPAPHISRASAPAVLLGAFAAQASATTTQQPLRGSFSASQHDYLPQPTRRPLRPQKKHVCKECGKAFNSSSNLCRHRRIHTGKKPYACQFCGFKFNNSSNRKKHERDYCKQRPGATSTRK